MCGRFSDTKKEKSRVYRQNFGKISHANCIFGEMNYGFVNSARWNGEKSEIIRVECTQTVQLPSFRFSGAPASAAGEVRDRLIGAFASCGLRLPSRRIIVGFTPRIKSSEIEYFDLPIAISILRAAKIIPQKNLESSMFLGRFALNGALVGTPELAALAAETSSPVVVPYMSSALLRSDQLSGGGGFRTLAEVIKMLREENFSGEKCAESTYTSIETPEVVRVEDIIGQTVAKRMLLLTAAGGHFGIFSGPHGWGKSLLARALWNLLPNLTESEIRALRRLYASRNVAFSAIPPFRTLEYSFSPKKQENELALAHRGVLFVDEVMEWPRAKLESLRVPLESGEVRPLVVAATNTCPCGRLGSSKLLCRCSPHDLKRYQRHLSGAFLDRFDLAAEVRDQHHQGLASPTTAELRVRVAAARARMLARQGILNAELRGEQAFAVYPWKKSAISLIERIFSKELTRRGYAAVARVALTVCDLREGDSVREGDVYEAAYFHPQRSFSLHPRQELR
jgi:magnesium chelatase family protein